MPEPIETPESLDDEESAEEAERLAAIVAAYDWEFARDLDVVYGPRDFEDPPMTWIVLPRRTADELLPFVEASTWGELRRRCTSAWFVLAVEASGLLDDLEASEGQGADAIDDDLPFSRFDLTDGNADSPFRPETAMEDWLPRDIADAFGYHDSTMFGDSWLLIGDIDDLLRGLASVGARIERADGLIEDLWNAN